MKAYDVVRHRLLAQRLWGTGAPDAGTALRSLLAVQAQEFPYARWSLAQRCAGNHRDNPDPVDANIADGTVLRTHVLRPTWHFVHRKDLHWLMELSAPRVRAGNQGRDRELGLDAGTIARSNEVLAAAVAGGRHLTREELAAELDRAGLLEDSGAKLRGAPVRTQQTGHLLMHAELDMVLVSGAPRTSPGGALKQTYALFDERVPAAAPVDRGEALARLTLRYFSSRGPATIKDCSLWSGLTMADIRTGLADAGDSLTMREFDGGNFYLAAAAGRAPAAPRADLLQCYDEMVMGYTPTRGYLQDPAAAQRPPLPGMPAQTGTAALLHPLLINGFVAGLWRHIRKPDAVIEVRPHRSFSVAEERAVDRAVARYTAFQRIPAAQQRL